MMAPEVPCEDFFGDCVLWIHDIKCETNFSHLKDDCIGPVTLLSDTKIIGGCKTVTNITTVHISNGNQELSNKMNNTN